MHSQTGLNATRDRGGGSHRGAPLGTLRRGSNNLAPSRTKGEQYRSIGILPSRSIRQQRQGSSNGWPAESSAGWVSRKPKGSVVEPALSRLRYTEDVRFVETWRCAWYTHFAAGQQRRQPNPPGGVSWLGIHRNPTETPREPHGNPTETPRGITGRDQGRKRAATLPSGGSAADSGRGIRTAAALAAAVAATATKTLRRRMPLCNCGPMPQPQQRRGAQHWQLWLLARNYA